VCDDCRVRFPFDWRRLREGEFPFCRSFYIRKPILFLNYPNQFYIFFSSCTFASGILFCSLFCFPPFHLSVLGHGSHGLWKTILHQESCLILYFFRTLPPPHLYIPFLVHLYHKSFFSLYFFLHPSTSYYEALDIARGEADRWSDDCRTKRWSYFLSF
jgi:hypothetical protein